MSTDQSPSALDKTATHVPIIHSIYKSTVLSAATRRRYTDVTDAYNSNKCINYYVVMKDI